MLCYVMLLLMLCYVVMVAMLLLIMLCYEMWRMLYVRLRYVIDECYVMFIKARSMFTKSYKNYKIKYDTTR